MAKNDLIVGVRRVGTPITRTRPGVPAPKWRNTGWITVRSRIIRIKSTTANGADNKAREVGIRALVAGKELSSTNLDIQVRSERNLRPARIEGCLPYEQSRRDGIPTALPSASLVQFQSYVWQC